MADERVSGYYVADLRRVLMPGSTSRTVVHIIRAATYGGLCGIPHNPPNRTCGSPASGSPVGSCISHTERQFGAASSHRRSLAVPVASRAPGSQKLHGFTRGAPLQRAVRPVHALTAPSLPSVSPAPSLTHVMFRNSLPFHAGFLGKATPAGLRPSVIPPHLRGPFPRRALPRVFSPTGLSATLPARPAPRGVPVAACTAPAGLPVLLRLPSSMHADATTPAETVQCSRRSLPDQPAAFPSNPQGRLPRSCFRGLLSVHSRFGPHVR